jgi:hypothetical protein
MDIFGKKVFPEDIVIYPDNDYKKVKVGIVEKLTPTGFKIIGDGRTFKSESIVRVSEDDPNYDSVKEKLKKVYDEVVDYKKTKHRNVIYLKNEDNVISMSETRIDYKKSAERPGKILEFTNKKPNVRYSFLAYSKKDDRVYFTQDVNDCHIVDVSISYEVFSQYFFSNFGVEYLDKDEYDSYKDKIADLKNAIEHFSFGSNPTNYSLSYVGYMNNIYIDNHDTFEKPEFDNDFLFKVRKMKHTMNGSLMSNEVEIMQPQYECTIYVNAFLNELIDIFVGDTFHAMFTEDYYKYQKKIVEAMKKAIKELKGEP